MMVDSAQKKPIEVQFDELLLDVSIPHNENVNTKVKRSMFICTYLEVSTLRKAFTAIWKCTHERFNGPMYLFMSLQIAQLCKSLIASIISALK